MKLLLLVIPVLMGVILLPSCRLLGAAAGLGMAKLQFGCLPEGTTIDTPHGPVAIEQLKTGDEIIGFDGRPVAVSQIHQYREDPLTSRYVTVHFADGQTVSSSLRHRIDGIPAANLEAGDRIGDETVARIETRHGVSRSFDLLTGDRGYRIGDIPVNSMIEEMLGR